MYLAIIQCKVRSFLISFFIIDFHPVHLEILLDFFLICCETSNATAFNNTKLLAYLVIHLQFWAYGSWDSLFPISTSPTANLMSPEHYF